MPGRYVLGVGGADPAEAADSWARSHAARSGSAFVRVRVGSSGDRGAPPDARGAHAITIAGTDAAGTIALPAAPIPAAVAEFLRPDDILVIGTGKTGFIRSRVFGTLTLQIVALAPCTVAVVPEVDLRFRAGVVAGVKDDDLMSHVVRAAADEAAAREERVQLVHSSFAGIVPAPVPIGRDVLERAKAVAMSRRPGAGVWARASARQPAEALLDASRNASLLVIGAGRSSGASRTLGSVVHDVLVNINAPVLIVRHAPVI